MSIGQMLRMKSALAPQVLRSGLFDIGDLRRNSREQNEAHIRGLCQNAYLGDQTAICRVLGRYKMFVATDDVSLSTHLLLDGYWEMWVTEAIVDTVCEGMVAVDVGANLGYFTLLLADLCGASGTVHAFEPNPDLLSRLTRTLDVNGFRNRTQVHSSPLSGQDGLEVRLIVPKGEPKNGHIAPAEIGLGDHSANLKTRRLDSIEDLTRVDFIKIDAEGAEEGIWDGMQSIIDRKQPLTVFLEYTKDRYSNPKGFLEKITSGGFSIAVIDPQQGIKSVSVSQVLAGPGHEDWMLVLKR